MISGPLLALSPGVRLRVDGARAETLLVTAERGFVLSETAAAALHLVDGTRDVATIAAALRERFEAPEAQLEGDITELLNDLVRRRLVVERVR